MGQVRSIMLLISGGNIKVNKTNNQETIAAESGTSLFANGLIWFGAGVSLAEILSGTSFATLGLVRGALAILAGHLIGGLLMFLAGVIGAKTRKSSMETVKLSFGKYGSLLFCVLNITQLVGWTAIMIYDGALAANGIFDIGSWIWCLIIGILIALWIFVGIKSLEKLNTAAMALLFLLTLILCKVIFFDGNGSWGASDGISFGAAVELAIAMPLSWLPLISDYTSKAKEPVKASAVSAVTYSIISCWMYFIGMGAAALAGSSDIAQIMLSAGLGIAGLVIIIFSTVTTTYLDAFSAGVSAVSLSKKISDRWFAIAVTGIGTILAIIFPMDDITGFLYFIGSVFAPMIAVLIADFFILKRNSFNSGIDIANLIVWFAGFVCYRLFMRIDLITGSTIPAMAITFVLCLIVGIIRKKSSK